MEREAQKSLSHINGGINLTIRNGFNFLETTLCVGFENNQKYSIVEISLKMYKWLK